MASSKPDQPVVPPRRSSHSLPTVNDDSTPPEGTRAKYDSNPGRRREDPHHHYHPPKSDTPTADGHLKLLDKRFQPAAMLIAGAVAFLLAAGGALTMLEGVLKSRIEEALKAEIIALKSSDVQNERSVKHHEERITKLEQTQSDIQITLAGIKQANTTTHETLASMQRDLRDILKRDESRRR